MESDGGRVGLARSALAGQQRVLYSQVDCGLTACLSAQLIPGPPAAAAAAAAAARFREAAALLHRLAEPKINFSGVMPAAASCYKAICG